MQQLDDRLKALADLVAEGARVADIGTDHGYLAIDLIKSGRASFVIAGDKNKGPYEAARRTVKLAGLNEENISVRLGDGLQVLKPDEVDTVCIAGMGGILMTEILAAATLVTNKLGTLILQPMNGALELRAWLYANDWHIVKEKLAVADGRLYEIICAKKGRAAKPSHIELLVGPTIIKEQPPLFKNHIEALLFSMRRVLNGMKKSETAKETEKYKMVQQDIKELEELLK